MKSRTLKLLFLSFLSLMFFSGMSYADGIKGINYDPAHSAAYIKAQESNNINVITQIINADLDKMHRMSFTSVKTFYSKFCTYAGSCVNFADLAVPKGFKVMLGVYEFIEPKKDKYGSGERSWTSNNKDGQVEIAIASANKYPGSVIGIVVGNEDAYAWNGDARDNLQKNIVTDIKKIKGSVPAQVKVLSAQRQPDWERLLANDPNGLLKNLDVVGTNIYPFWGDSPEQVNGASVASKIPADVEKLKAKMPGKTIIVTEEGWPSAGNNAKTQDKNISSLKNYYTTWKARQDNFDSYYFAAFDKYSSEPHKANDADQHFGLCKIDGNAKEAAIVHCN